MSTWRQFAEQVQRGDAPRANRDERDDRAQTDPIASIVPNVPLDPTRALKRWRSALADLDVCKPLHGIEPRRWGTLCEDAAWIVRCFGEQAARDCWSSADMFGLWPDKPNWGGVVHRLQGSRSLVLTCDRASWRSFGLVEGFNRDSYPDLPPFWEGTP